MSYIALHVHSDLSLLDGISKRSDLIAKCKEYGQSALAETNHGNLSNHISFYTQCVEAGIKPLLGCEAYIAPNSRFDKAAKAKEEKEEFEFSDKYYHLILLAKNADGYQNLKKLSTLSFREGYYYKPRIDFEILQAHSKGLIALSACVGSITSQAIIRGQKDKAREYINKFRYMFGEDFYLELMQHDMPEDKIVSEALIEFGKELGIGTVLTNDSHYTNKEDWHAHEIALCINTRTTITDPKRFKFPGSGYWYKSPAEMIELQKRSGYPAECISNSVAIANKIEDYAFKLKKFIVPKYKDSKKSFISDESHDKLVEMCYEGLAALGKDGDMEYVERLEYELDVMKRKNFSSYFLIIADIVQFIKNHGKMLRPVGRGSSVGSLVCYSLGITAIDPIKFNVPFYRFINEGRKDLPDIDTDISRRHRGEVIKYIQQKYGADKVAQICTYQAMAAKSAIDNVGRALDVPAVIRKSISKMLGGDVTKDEQVEDLLDQHGDAKLEMNKYAGWIDNAIKLQGTYRTKSTHAAGIVIANDAIDTYSPLGRDEDGFAVTQYDMGDCALLGLLKLDMLGLRTLDVIYDTVVQVKAHYGVDIDIYNMKLDDPDVYKLMQQANFVSVFQYDSQGMRAMSKKLHPENFDHLIALNALYRPGCLEPGSGTNGKSIADNYIERRHGREEIESWHVSLDQIVKETFGMCIHEDAMVTLSNGDTKEIKNISIGDVVISDKSTLNTVKAKINNGVKDLIEIKTSKLSIKVTPDHVILVNGKEKRARDIKVGDFVHTPYVHIKYNDHDTLTVDQAYCVGMLLGDGSLSKHTVAVRSGNDVKWANQCADIFRNAFDHIDPIVLRSIDKRDGGHVYDVSLRCNKTTNKTTPFKNLLRSYGLIGQTTRNKHIPQAIFESSDSIKRNVLAGLWDSDGTIIGPVHFYSSSVVLADQVRRLLSHFHISHYAPDTNRVYVRDTQKFMDLVPLRHYKKTKLQKQNGKYMKFAVEHVLDECVGTNSNSEAARKLGTSHQTIRQLRNGSRNFVTKQLLEQINVTSYEEVVNAYYDDHDSEQVVSVALAGTGVVYDLSMEDSSIPWFTAGGMIVHNCLFQEQISEMSKIISGFNDTEADEFRAAIGKKDQVKFDAAINKLKLKGVEHGHAIEFMDTLSLKLAGFARYSWNLGHASGYSKIAYITAYLEAHYPAEYYTALLNNNDDSATVSTLLAAIMQHGVQIKQPDVNNSSEIYTTDGKAIYMGISSVSKIGGSATCTMLVDREQNGPYSSYINFVARVSNPGSISTTDDRFIRLIGADKCVPGTPSYQLKTLNKTIIENLIKAGCFKFDDQMTDKDKIAVLPDIQKYTKKNPNASELEVLNYVHEKITCDEYTDIEKSEFERSALNFYVSGHPVTHYMKYVSSFYSDRQIITPSQLKECDVNTGVVIMGLLVSKEVKTTKNGKPYLTLKLQDQFGDMYARIWSPLCEEITPHLVVNQVAMVKAVVIIDNFRGDQLDVKTQSAVTIGSGVPVMGIIADTEKECATVEDVTGNQLSKSNNVSSKNIIGLFNRPIFMQFKDVDTCTNNGTKLILAI